MTIEEAIVRFFRMDDRNRYCHTNPWSVYTRFTMIPLLRLAVWSMAWLNEGMKDATPEYKSWLH